jgi:transcriptional regulator with XRE-family HTH domain
METTIKVNQAAIAKILDVSESTVSLWVNGLRKPKSKNLIKLSILTDSEPQTWLNGESEQIKELLNKICIEIDTERNFRTGKIKQGYIAKQAGITQTGLSQILNGIKAPSWARAKKLYQVTGIEPEIWMEAKTNNELLKTKFMEYQINGTTNTGE